MKTQLRVSPTQVQVNSVTEIYSKAHLDLITSNFLPSQGFSPIVIEGCEAEDIKKIEAFYEENSKEVCMLRNDRNILLLIKLTRLPELLFIIS
jgi:molybdopterin-guanine dinucleotide biosynthesis protein